MGVNEPLGTTKGVWVPYVIVTLFITMNNVLFTENSTRRCRVLLSAIKHSIQRYLTVIITFEGATIQRQ